MHGRSHSTNDLLKGKAAADLERNRRAFVTTRKRRLGHIHSFRLDVGSLPAARKAATKRLWQNARSRAKVRRISFSIRASEFELPMNCPVLGTPLAFHSVAADSNADACAMLERINSDQGYELGNVAVMSTRASRLRGDATTAELASMARFFAPALGSTR
jgi:hypothetical protein